MIKEFGKNMGQFILSESLEDLMHFDETDNTVRKIKKTMK